MAAFINNPDIVEMVLFEAPHAIGEARELTITLTNNGPKEVPAVATDRFMVAGDDHWKPAWSRDTIPAIPPFGGSVSVKVMQEPRPAACIENYSGTKRVSIVDDEMKEKTAKAVIDYEEAKAKFEDSQEALDALKSDVEKRKKGDAKNDEVSATPANVDTTSAAEVDIELARADD